ncbi:hypothetical protein [Nonomuraea polychroma]|uniref:hypothetical protein n=1 Tax=Nonomuraea polychroma TaxID=46176 RepID=UPI000FDD90E0|nr:hypothetical protein [Nonomuraea polychroma]
MPDLPVDSRVLDDSTACWTVTFMLLFCDGLDRDLTWLAQQVADRVLSPEITWRGGWDDVPDAVGALVEHRLHGKAVLDLA